MFAADVVTENATSGVLQKQTDMWNTFLLAVLRSAVAKPRMELWSSYYVKRQGSCWQYSNEFQRVITEGCNMSSATLLAELIATTGDQPVIIVLDEAGRLGGPSGLENWQVIRRDLELAKITNSLNRPAVQILPFVCAAVATVSAGVAFHQHTDLDSSYQIRDFKVGLYTAITWLILSMDRVTIIVWDALFGVSKRTVLPEFSLQLRSC
eukprot:3936227-Rhodomonas_salina.1